MKKIDKLEIGFNIGGEESPELKTELEGKTLEEAWKIIMEENNKALSKIRTITGDSKYTEYVDRFLTPREKAYLTLAQGLKRMT